MALSTSADRLFIPTDCTSQSDLELQRNWSKFFETRKNKNKNIPMIISTIGFVSCLRSMQKNFSSPFFRFRLGFYATAFRENCHRHFFLWVVSNLPSPVFCGKETKWFEESYCKKISRRKIIKSKAYKALPALLIFNRYLSVYNNCCNVIFSLHLHPLPSSNVDYQSSSRLCNRGTLRACQL